MSSNLKQLVTDIVCKKLGEMINGRKNKAVVEAPTEEQHDKLLMELARVTPYTTLDMAMGPAGLLIRVGLPNKGKEPQERIVVLEEYGEVKVAE